MSADQRFVRVVTQQDGPRAPWVRGTRGAGSREKNKEERSNLRQRMEALERRAEEAERERDAAAKREKRLRDELKDCELKADRSDSRMRRVVEENHELAKENKGLQKELLDAKEAFEEYKERKKRRKAERADKREGDAEQRYN